jgi:hypothetical protein
MILDANPAETLICAKTLICIDGQFHSELHSKQKRWKVPVSTNPVGLFYPPLGSCKRGADHAKNRLPP